MKTTSTKSISKQKETGSHYTPSDLAELISEKLLKQETLKGKENIKVLDPSCGDGELLLAIQKIGLQKGYNLELYGVDSDSESLALAQKRLDKMNYNNYTLINKDFLELVDDTEDLTLFSTSEEEIPPVDIIIANPPYVRTQVLGGEKTQKLSKKYGIKGKIDLYQIFLVAMTKLLKTGGALGVITSNRYLNTKGGETTRKFLINNYEISEIIDLGDTKFFSAAVLPAILFGVKSEEDTEKRLLSKQTDFLKIYENNNSNTENSKKYSNLIDLLNVTSTGTYSVSDKVYSVSTGKLITPENYKEPWILATDEEYSWFEKVNDKSFATINTFAKVKVGVKTTADAVFIRSDWQSLPSNQIPEDNILYPLVSSEDAEKWKVVLNNHDKLILYPHEVVDGKRVPIDLEEYPKAGNYLKEHRERLEGRKYVIKANKKWFEIWVPHNPEKWKDPKLVFPDISVEPKFFFDNEGTIVDGNCYWITLKENVSQELLYLIMGTANSTFMSKYHDIAFQNKLYAGRRRYLTQYVGKYPLINPDSLHAKEIIMHVEEIIFNDLGPEEIESKESKINTLLYDYYELENRDL